MYICKPFVYLSWHWRLISYAHKHHPSPKHSWKRNLLQSQYHQHRISACPVSLIQTGRIPTLNTTRISHPKNRNTAETQQTIIINRKKKSHRLAPSITNNIHHNICVLTRCVEDTFCYSSNRFPPHYDELWSILIPLTETHEAITPANSSKSSTRFARLYRSAPTKLWLKPIFIRHINNYDHRKLRVNIYSSRDF